MNLVLIGIALLLGAVVMVSIWHGTRTDKREVMHGYLFGFVASLVANGLAALIVGLWQMNQV